MCECFFVLVVDIFFPLVLDQADCFAKLLILCLSVLPHYTTRSHTSSCEIPSLEQISLESILVSSALSVQPSLSDPLLQFRPIIMRICQQT